MRKILKNKFPKIFLVINFFFKKFNFIYQYIYIQIFILKTGNKIFYGKRKLRTESKILYLLRKTQKKLEKFIKGYETNIESGVWFLDRVVVQ